MTSRSPLAFRNRTWVQQATLVQRPGAYQDGEWQAGTPRRSSIQVISQPVMAQRDESANLSRVSEERVFYLEAGQEAVPISGGNDPRLADQIVMGEVHWVVSMVEDWGSHLLVTAYRGG